MGWYDAKVFAAALGEGDAHGHPFLQDVEELLVLLPLLRMLRVRHPQKAGALNLDRLSCCTNKLVVGGDGKGATPSLSNTLG